MKNYESVIVLTPVLSDDQLKETVKKFRELITEQGGEIIHEDNWGLTKLAYPIQKKSTGFYHIFEYKAPGTIVAPLELALKRDERIMRFLTVSLDKHGVIYNQRKRNGEFKSNKGASAATAAAPGTKVQIEEDQDNG
ncbi:MAG: 30S ribosomal protein S6 [Bacteroidota bacterium]|nr:30S ribosomal protein S6 [Bacteroidota bacterium]MDX5431315.1 30S ribosomal protein S6 [Bacteroidota bacterium]MDX5470053.1 30S ribosomal protein S6 [Bacteroidota bacterium]